MATNGRRRTKGAGSIIHRKDGSWEFRREVGRDPATGKRRYVSAKGRTKADARERFDAKVAEMERTGLLPGAKSPYLKDYAERWLEEYRLNVKAHHVPHPRRQDSCVHGGHRLYPPHRADP